MFGGVSRRRGLDAVFYVPSQMLAPRIRASMEDRVPWMLRVATSAHAFLATEGWLAQPIHQVSATLLLLTAAAVGAQWHVLATICIN